MACGGALFLHKVWTHPGSEGDGERALTVLDTLAGAHFLSYAFGPKISSFVSTRGQGCKQSGPVCPCSPHLQ